MQIRYCRGKPNRTNSLQNQSDGWKAKCQWSTINLAMVGRYILTSDIFDEIRQTEASVDGEIQLTYALSKPDEVYGMLFEERLIMLQHVLIGLKHLLSLVLKIPQRMNWLNIWKLLYNPVNELYIKYLGIITIPKYFQIYFDFGNMFLILICSNIFHHLQMIKLVMINVF